jgi:hypothetical protein
MRSQAVSTREIGSLFFKPVNAFDSCGVHNLQPPPILPLLFSLKVSLHGCVIVTCAPATSHASYDLVHYHTVAPVGVRAVLSARPTAGGLSRPGGTGGSQQFRFHGARAARF